MPNLCNSRMILYANDSAKVCGNKNIHYLKIKTEIEFQKLENWIKSNRLLLNYNKIKYVVFSQTNHENFFVKLKNGKICNLQQNMYQVPWSFYWLQIVLGTSPSFCRTKLSIVRMSNMYLYQFWEMCTLAFVYPYLYYGRTSWGNAAAKDTITKFKFCKIISDAPCGKMKLFPLYLNHYQSYSNRKLGVR